MPRLFAGLTQICSHRSGTSLGLDASVACPANVVRLNFTERKRSYIVNHEGTLLEFLPVGIAKLGVKDGEREKTRAFSFTRSHRPM